MIHLSYPLENKLVIGIASSALFDLKDSDVYFREKRRESISRISGC
ncbi:5'-nucleotidase [Gleimia sp. 6138-11-ORH1]